MPVDTERWRLGRGEQVPAWELLESYHDFVAGCAPGAGFAEGLQEVCDVGLRARRVAVRPGL